MAKRNISIADTFYDRCCCDYTLKSRDIGRYMFGSLAGLKSRLSSYRIENVGVVTIIRAEDPLGCCRTESCIFTPQEKDAPILVIDSVKKWFKKDRLSINIIKSQLKELNYRQFETLEESFSRLADAEVPAMWYNSLLIRGSVAKEGDGAELASMLEEYMNAYLRIVQFAEPCDPMSKAEKTKEFSHRFLTGGGTAIEAVSKGLGESTGEFLDKVAFPV